jgi:hypothetical protein
MILTIPPGKTHVRSITGKKRDGALLKYSGKFA